MTTLVDHRTYVIAGDGCLMEGISHEAISLAGHLKLAKLIVLFDDNEISIDGRTSLSCSDDQLARFAACGWSVRRIDGHDRDAIAAAIAAERETDKPSLIACRTVIGFGAPNKQGSEKVHGAPLGAEEIAAARESLGWPHAPFEIPAPVAEAWAMVGARGAADRKAWEQRLAAQGARVERSFAAATARELGADFDQAMADIRRRFAETAPKIATRQASKEVLDAIVPATPVLVGGSADLTHSNLTQAKGQPPVTPRDCFGSYIHFGIREHGMAAALNGIALHGGFVPYGGTFLAFADYSRPAIRLGALMGVKVVHVMTHDSIGLGEDGPTHQPVEQVASLRAIPNLNVFRPADAVETAESWECALRADGRPSVLCLTRQALPTLRTDVGGENRTSRGAYVLVEPEGWRDVTIIATGSEVSLAVAAAASLAREGVRAAVVSAPCFELFKEQDAEYRAGVLGRAPRVGVEAALDCDWARWLGDGGRFVGMTGFGASAPAEVLYREFGITVEAVIAAAHNAMEHGRRSS